MNSKYNIWILAVLSFWLVVGLNACSDDNSTGSQEECTTSLPSEFAPVGIDQSYFASQTEPDPQDEQYSTYFQVQQIATTGSAFFSEGAGPFGLANTLLLYAQLSSIQPEFEDGSCVWTISPPPGQTGGLDLTVTVYATPTSNGADWEIFYDGELGEEGVEVENFRILTGFTSSDNLNGEWNYYSPENPGSPLLTYTWDIESETSFELDLSISDGSFGIGGMNYVKDGAENFLTFDDSEDVTSLYWNEDNDSGWIETSEGRLCYTDFVNSACS